MPASPSRARIALLHPVFGAAGGAEVLALTQARFLAELGFGVELVTYAYQPSTWDGRVGDLPVVAFRPAVRGSVRVPRGLSSPEARWAKAQLPRYDAVMVHNYPCSTLLGHAGFQGRTIWYCHEPPRSLYPMETNPYLHERAGETSLLDPLARKYRVDLFQWRIAMRLGLGRARRRREDLAGVANIGEVWANSEFTRQNVLNVYGQRDVKVVYPAIPFPEGLARRRGLDRGGLRVLCLTRLERVKNVDTVVRGFARFLSRGGGGGALHIVGEGSDRGHLERLCRRLGVAASVRFHGFVSDEELDRIAAGCDVFALLPIDEPFGMVFPEAAARGLLLIGPDHGGPLETLEGGAIGDVVPALSPEALSEALLAVSKLSDEEVGARRLAAFRSCEARFSLKVLRCRLEELLLS